jgi:predicted nucleic acid-binding protein
MNGFAYIDASAMVKFFISEPESAALTATVESEWPFLMASEILSVEAARAALRAGRSDLAPVARWLQSVALLPLTDEIRKGAARVGPPTLRALDAIHLSTALSASERIGAVLTYDKLLAAACADAGLRVVAPA